MHGHIRSPEHKVMYKQSQCIKKINQYQMPVFSEIYKYPSIFLTVVREKLVDLCPFQHGGNKESHGQCQKHTVGDADFTHKPKKERQQKGCYHARQEI